MSAPEQNVARWSTRSMGDLRIPMEQDMRPTYAPEPDDVAAVREGQWVIIRDWNLHVRQVTKVTAKLLKLGAGSQRYPTQIGRDDRRVLGAVDDRAAADKDRSERVKAAEDARNTSIAKLFADARGAA